MGTYPFFPHNDLNVPAYNTVRSGCLGGEAALDAAPQALTTKPAPTLSQ